MGPLVVVIIFLQPMNIVTTYVVAILFMHPMNDVTQYMCDGVACSLCYGDAVVCLVRCSALAYH